MGEQSVKSYLHPKWLFVIQALAALAIAAVASYVLTVNFFGDKSGPLTDLLVTVVGISGITVPLAIAYLTLGKEKEVFITISERIPHLLDVHSLETADVLSCFLFLKGQNGDKNADQHRPASLGLTVLYEMLKFKDEVVAGVTLSGPAKDKLLTGNTRPLYEKYFEHHEDKKALHNYVWLVGATAILSFAALYVDYFEPHFKWLYFIQHFLVITTFLANVLTYVYLLRLIGFRDTIHREADERIRMLCEGIQAEITLIKTSRERLAGATKVDLEKILAQMLSGAAPGPRPAIASPPPPKG